MSPEVWRPIPGYEGFYEVSSQGRVRSVDRVVQLTGRWGTREQRRYKGRLLKRTACKHGYLRIALSTPSGKETRTVHSLVMEAFVGTPPPDKEICHRDGVEANCALSNLRYDTRSSNREDSRRMGRLAVGERIAQHKLTEEQVAEIRASPLSSNLLAEFYPVQGRQIRRIRAGECWKND